MSALQDIKKELQHLANKETAKHSQRFFKTGKGEYGEGDIFLGIRVPILRKLAKKHPHLSLPNIQSLLKSKFHEQRLLAVIMLVNQYKLADKQKQKEIFTLYTNNTKYINNWDLVDISAANIVGAYLSDKNKKLLYDFSASDDLWQRRIAVISTYYFIRNNDFTDCLNIAERLLNDPHDLIHKAVGWMLREIGKKNQPTEEAFLDKYAYRMPRTMLRYALEKFPANLKKSYMAMKHGLTAHES